VLSLLAMLALSRLRVKLLQHDEDPRPNLVDVPGVPIYEGVSVTQEFIAEDDNITSVALQLATYARENPGVLQIEIAKRRKRKWVPLTTASLEKRLLVDNAYQVFSFAKPVNVHAGDKLALTLSADGPFSSAITWRLFSELNLPGHRLRIGPEVVPGTASFTVSYLGAAGMAGGPYMRGRLWNRITTFLHAPGQVLLASGSLLALFSLICLLLAPVPERALEDEDEPGSHDAA
jgi:hypothetical protein